MLDDIVGMLHGPDDLFSRLPPTARREVSDRRRRELELEAAQAIRRRAALVRAVIDGAVIFAITEGFFVSGSLGRLLLALVVGILVGLVWHGTRAGRTLSPVIALPAFMLTVWPEMPIFAFAVMGCLAAARGVIRESSSLFSG